MTKAINWERRGKPVLLVDQLMAWAAYRDGEFVSQIGIRLHRPVRETRAILWGTNE